MGDRVHFSTRFFFLYLAGFKLDPGKYSNFLVKTLASAELAPVRLFKRVCGT